MLVEPLYGKGGPVREASAREESKAAPEAAAKAPAASAPARGIGVGSRVQDSEGTCGEIVEANNAWLTMRTDAGEERKVRKFTLKLIASETGAAPALKAAAKAAPVTSAASQPAGGDVRITRTRTRDERDAELRRNAIDVEAVDVEQPTVTNVPQGERFTFCPPCADAEEGGAAAAVDDDDANSDADADAAADDEDDNEDEDEDKEEECAACGGTDTLPGNEIMLCDGDGCDGAWHQLCLRPAVVDVPEEDEASPPPTQSLPLP